MATWRLVNGKQVSVDGIMVTLYDLVHDGEYVKSGQHDALAKHAKENGEKREWFADGKKTTRLQDMGGSKGKR